MKVQVSDFYPPPGEYRRYGRLTSWTNRVVRTLTLILSIVGIPFVMVFTLVGGILAAIPGVALVYWSIVESGFWLLAAFLRLSSQAWRAFPLGRFLLLPIGLVVSPLGYLLVALVGGVNAGVKYRKLVFAGACESWPLADSALESGEKLASRVTEKFDGKAFPNIHWR